MYGQYVLATARNGFASRLVLSARRMSSNAPYNFILTSKPAPNVSLITLNRPKALNALSTPLMLEISKAVDEAETDEAVGAVVITGSERAFAGKHIRDMSGNKLMAKIVSLAGADIKEMRDKQFAEAYKSDFLENWTRISKMKKPIIAAVSGFALGGGCELAMACDIILASPTAVFGQPEINLGVIPGAGGSQRLTHAIGKSRAMEIILTGRSFSAKEAETWGLVSKVVSEGEGEVVKEAVKMASIIASKGRISVQAGKEAVNAAYELQLAEGLRLERRLFHPLFATNDQKEGMGAFVEKRKPNFTHT